MPDYIETLIDGLFSEPYGLDDCMELGRILNNPFLTLEKDINVGKRGEGEYEDESKRMLKKLKTDKILNLYVSHETKHEQPPLYINHYRLHSETAINTLDYFIKKVQEIHKKEELEKKEHPDNKEHLDFIKSIQEMYKKEYLGKKEYLENKLSDFFKSYEWETWAWKYAESISEPNHESSEPCKAPKKRISATLK
jgi:hypothetical protein